MFHLFLYTCLVLVIRGPQRGQPRPIFIITVRGKHWAVVGGVEVITHHVIRYVKMTSAGG